MFLVASRIKNSTKCMQRSNHSTIIPNLIDTGCKCAGKNNIYGDGSECKFYSGYTPDWYNGRWCYANVDTCPDAKAHPDYNLPGYGASKAACGTGIY